MKWIIWADDRALCQAVDHAGLPGVEPRREDTGPRVQLHDIVGLNGETWARGGTSGMPLLHEQQGTRTRYPQ